MTRWLAIAAFVFCACGPKAPPATPNTSAPRLDSITCAMTLVPGSLLRGAGNLGSAAGQPTLELVDATSNASVVLAQAAGAASNELLFALDSGAFSTLGEGAHMFRATLVVGDARGNTATFSATLASVITPTLTSIAVSGTLHHNDSIVLHGAGLLAPNEGATSIHFAGMFIDDMSATSTINADFDVTPVETFDRARGVFTLGTALGGIRPGTFTGSVSLSTTPTGGTASTTSTVATTIEIAPPAIYTLTPASASLGEYVVIAGAGFIGCTGTCDEVTTVTLSGTFTDSTNTATDFGPVDLVPEFVSGQEVRFVVDTEVVDGALQSALFHAKNGTWQGTAVVTTTKGHDSVLSAPIPGRFTLARTKQVVYLKFLPGFLDALPLFGLTEAATQIEAGIASRVASIYADYNVDVRTVMPEDFAPTGFTTVEIGGIDPNGTGLFGYDNSPGKDINNLRIFDTIGGANAATQSDGYPGYGGIFVESLLYFSYHSSLPNNDSIDPDPVFDEIFDPVRTMPAKLSEVQGYGESQRVASVQRAVRALSNIVGETTAHEFGHSLGLANPTADASLMIFHDPGNNPGCLMESGVNRPVGERAAEPGFTPTHFCYDTDYLQSILGK